MYEHLKGLTKNGVPDFSSLKRFSESETANLNETHIEAPFEYVQYLKEVGHGEWLDEDGFAPYYFLPTLENASEEYFKDTLIYEIDADSPAAKGIVWLFACDSIGQGFGFDSGDSWRVVRIDTGRSVERLDLSFLKFIEGLVVCYPIAPVSYADGKWFDGCGDSYPDE
ncbi:hypothetical protein [Uliginosibacterium sp. H1]|uniref:hypothetical protein n=1 Tax=Uliginosibacterium sp. H1 TaxID=3114757 RepID=UPI002E19A028|nr:hypothetical protein [Uliginosibacterium sp. H1]